MKFLKAVGKIFLVLALVVVGFIAYDRYNSQLLRSFCGSLSVGLAADAVLTAAKEKNFVIFDLIDRIGVISVLNHKSPFFRYECRVSVSNGQITSAQINAAD
ncbi:hypothetical protein [Paralysiella testudinis]|uniref:Uncharacterized protein n=1 Tax=Paralysiella testudinis TaxID=2809020 RepID=A0A892ZI79_9NEIS|nr:hypothetical protein [Paralysiella testudinis]QRQ80639.1 hypothetical protein JQU52_07610 [Paralysiella testudinis]